MAGWVVCRRFARAVWDHGSTFWSSETEPDAKRQFLTLIFEASGWTNAA
jgi:hypothetical protein